MSDRNVTLTVTCGSKVVNTIDLTPVEAIDFVFAPMWAALDDGPAAWDLRETQEGTDRNIELIDFANESMSGVRP